MQLIEGLWDFMHLAIAFPDILWCFLEIRFYAWGWVKPKPSICAEYSVFVFGLPVIPAFWLKLKEAANHFSYIRKENKILNGFRKWNSRFCFHLKCFPASFWSVLTRMAVLLFFKTPCRWCFMRFKKNKLGFNHLCRWANLNSRPPFDISALCFQPGCSLDYN